MLFPLASRVLVPLQLDSQRNIQEAGGAAVPAREGEAWPGTGVGWELPPLELLMTRPSVRGGRPLCIADVSAHGDSEALVPSQHWTQLWGHVGRLG